MLAAEALSSGLTAAFYGGVFGIVKGVRARADADESETFWRVKTGRPATSKVPVLASPDAAHELIDFGLVHPELRSMEDKREFLRLWVAHGGPLHVVAPLRQPVEMLHPAFQTPLPAPHLHRRTEQSELEPASIVTASFMWMPDPAWEHLSSLLRGHAATDTYFGVTSFNDHGESPAYTFQELVAAIERREKVPFDLVIVDEMFEASGAFSSHTQVRLPLVHEPPELIVIRQGSVSATWLREAGFGVTVHPDAQTASRAAGLDDAELRRRLERLRRSIAPA